MVRKIDSAADQPNPLFNGPLETGVRAVVILNACYPRALDTTKLTWLDHLVVHTADIGGPPSLHPDIPQRTGELLIRRRLVEDGLQMMRKLHMVTVSACEDGISYQASEGAAPFVEGLKTQYAGLLKARAEWLAIYFLDNEDRLAELIEEKVGRWAVEFQGEINRPGERA
jgi:hypothetical protein